MFFRHPKCFLDIKIDTPSVFLTHQVFLDIKIDSPSVFLTHQVFFRHKNWHPKCFLTHQVFFKVQFPLVSSLLELQSKSWVLELKLEPSALQELSQSCSSDSAFRKGLIVPNERYWYNLSTDPTLNCVGQLCCLKATSLQSWTFSQSNQKNFKIHLSHKCWKLVFGTLFSKCCHSKTD